MSKQIFLLVLACCCFILELFFSGNLIENQSLRLGFNALLVLMGFSLMKLSDVFQVVRTERQELNKLAKILIFSGIALGVVLTIIAMVYLYF